MTRVLTVDSKPPLPLAEQLQRHLARKKQTPKELVQALIQSGRVLGSSPRANTWAVSGLPSMCVKIPLGLASAKRLSLPKKLQVDDNPDVVSLLSNPRLGMPFAYLGPVSFMRRIRGERISKPDEVGPPPQLTLDYFDIIEDCQARQRQPNPTEQGTIQRYHELLKSGHKARSLLHEKLANAPLPHYTLALHDAQEVAKQNHMLDFTHGGNILYDPKTKQFGFVDIQRPKALAPDETHCLKYFSPEGFLGALIQGSGSFGMPAPQLGLRYLALPPLTGDPKVDARKRRLAETIMGKVLTGMQEVFKNGAEADQPPQTTIPEKLQGQIRETLDDARRTRPAMVSARELPDPPGWGISA
jgi:hypothetical protein